MAGWTAANVGGRSGGGGGEAATARAGTSAGVPPDADGDRGGRRDGGGEASAPTFDDDDRSSLGSADRGGRSPPHEDDDDDVGRHRRGRIGDGDGGGGGSVADGGGRRSRRERGGGGGSVRGSETAEAALARLTASYGAALSCVGALHRADAELARRRRLREEGGCDDKRSADDHAGAAAAASGGGGGEAEADGDRLQGGAKKGDDTDAPASAPAAAVSTNDARDRGDAGADAGADHRLLRRVALAARGAFEDAVLLDPLVLPLAPTLADAFLAGDENESVVTTTTMPTEDATTPAAGGPALSSRTHRSTLRKLAYLSLVNYADLLTSCCCPCPPNLNPDDTGTGGARRDEQKHVLDRGVVKVLRGFRRRRCWRGGMMPPPPSSLESAKGGGGAARARDGADGREGERGGEDCADRGGDGGGGGDHRGDELQQPKNAAAVEEGKEAEDECDVDVEVAVRRLALSALVDASDLDGSDPTLWLRLASASRALGRAEDDAAEAAAVRGRDDGCEGEAGEGENSGSGGGDGSRLVGAAGGSGGEEGPRRPRVTRRDGGRYRRLERHALGRGLDALPDGVPPNRLLVRAMRELVDVEAEDETTTTTVSKRLEPPRREVVTIDLPRYSWSAAGRSLMRSCREGTTMARHRGRHRGRRRGGGLPSAAEEDPSFAFAFGSPAIRLHVSPILALPSTALATVCEFLGSGADDRGGFGGGVNDGDGHGDGDGDGGGVPLDHGNRDVKRLESTCRALSSSILRARAVMEEERNLGRGGRDGDGGGAGAPPPASPRGDDEGSGGRKRKREGGGDGGDSGGVVAEAAAGADGVVVGPSRSTTAAIQQTANGAEDGDPQQGQRPAPGSASVTNEDGSLPSPTPQENVAATTNDGGIQPVSSTTSDVAEESSSPPHRNRRGTMLNSRCSKRVRTKRQTSDKQAERTARRTSVHCCVFGALAGCRPEHPALASLLAADVDWQRLPPLAGGEEIARSVMSVFAPGGAAAGGDSPRSSSRQRQRQRSSLDGGAPCRLGSSLEDWRRSSRIVEATARGGDSSLNAFVELWSGNNSGPIDILRGFVVHVARHVDEVFSSEAADGGAGAMMLSSCVVDCFHVLANRAGHLARSVFSPSWVGPESVPRCRRPGGDGDGDVAVDVSVAREVFSLNLLLAELRMRRCERQSGVEIEDYDTDLHAVSFMVPKLLRWSSELCRQQPGGDGDGDGDAKSAEWWTSLQARCHWLAATFYLWVSRQSSDDGLSSDLASEAEEIGIGHIDKTLSYLERTGEASVRVVRTPHLESPSRTGPHWKQLSRENLSSFKDDLQAASVVVNARCRFRDVLREIAAKNDDDEQQTSGSEGGTNVDAIRDEHRVTIEAIAKDLMKRYGVEYEGLGGKHAELLNDYLSSSYIKTLFLDTHRGGGATDNGCHEGTGSKSDPTHDKGADQPADKCDVDDSTVSKWGSGLWHSIPTTFAASSLSETVPNPSLMTILSTCCSCASNEGQYELSLLKLLTRIVLAALDQRSQYLRQRSMNSRRSRSLSCDSAQNIFDDDDDDDLDCGSAASGAEWDDSDEDAGSPGRANQTRTKRKNARIRKDELLLMAASFFLDKISHLATTISNQLPSVALSAFLSSGDVVALINVSLCVASASDELPENSSYKMTSRETNLLENTLIGQPGGYRPRPDSQVSMIPLPNIPFFGTVCRFVDTITSASGRESKIQDSIESTFLTVLSKLVVQERKLFPSLLRLKGDRQRRSLRKKALVAKADFLAAVTSQMARLMSKHPFAVKDGKLEPSRVILLIVSSVHASDASSEDKSCCQDGPAFLSQVTEALLWFWTYVSDNDESGTESKSARTIETNTSSLFGSYVDRAVGSRLHVPVSAAIVALCGAAGNTAIFRDVRLPSKQAVVNEEESNNATLSDFFDSDASANDYVGDASDTEGDQADKASSEKSNRKVLLRSLAQLVQSIGLVFGRMPEKRACTQHLEGHKGPLLPLACARVLTRVSNILMEEFCDRSKDTVPSENDRIIDLYAEEYPYGTRVVGSSIDNLLFKVYYCLHGFVLGSSCTVAGRDKTSLTILSPLHDPSKVQFFPPENVDAAVNLYRLIKRAYPTKGRKSAPKAAFECVASSLPPMVDTARRTSLREFLYCNPGKGGCFSTSFGFDSPRTQLPKGFPAGIFDEGGDEHVGHEIPADCVADMETSKLHGLGDNELRVIWKGVCHELAKGPLPTLGSNKGASSFSCVNHEPSPTDALVEESNKTEEREATSRHEQALSKKFTAILDDLCFSPCNFSSWFVAGQCLSSLADLIRDRVGLLDNCFDVRDLCPTPTSFQDERSTGLPLHELRTIQAKEKDAGTKEWIPCLGSDLSSYIRHPWSNFATLCVCSKEVGESVLVATANGEDRSKKGENSNQPDAISASVPTAGRDFLMEHKAWKDISLLHDDGSFPAWQRAWGGLYIGALRVMAGRCHLVSYYLATQKTEHYDPSMVAEICETMGTAKYGEMQGSTRYGYPAKLMTEKGKHDLAQQAAKHFQESVDLMKESSNGEARWEIFFMLGKCKEKMARSLQREAYPQTLDVFDEALPKRQYEELMEEAFKSYAYSLQRVNKCLEDGTLPDVQVGGSSHGVAEVIYRINASRLKALLLALRRRKSDRKWAELEAIRLTSKYWFKEASSNAALASDVDEINTKEKMWDILVDCVAALAESRIENVYFHRSVYRHAQAILWAPVFNDPDQGMSKDGNLANLPLAKATLLLGNNADTCEKTAATIMEALFEKKRLQLCAVWVTTSTVPSPFEELNNSVRKYDSLRAKYTGAFIECMRRCGEVEKLEKLLNWSNGCVRDLPSLYYKSAEAGGGPPRQQHVRDSLLDGTGYLWFTKRFANAATADAVIRQLADLQKLGGAELAQRRGTLKDYLGVAYSCFMRLNCSVGEVRLWAVKSGRARVMEVEALLLAYRVARMEKGYQFPEIEVASNMSETWRRKVVMLQSVLVTCERLFPDRAALYKRKRKRLSSRRKVSGESQVKVRADDTGAHGDTLVSADDEDILKKQKLAE